MTHFHLLRSAALAAAIALLQPQAAVASKPELLGAGAVFPFPLYATWLAQFSRAPAVRNAYNSTGVRVSYESADSASGIAELIAGKVDFAASDTAITDEQIGQVERGVVALPITAGSIVLAYNLPGVDALRLPRQVYPKILAGKITQWNDPAIAAANPDVALPALPITVVVRADATRASEVLTAHLSVIDPDFQTTIGRSRAPAWPEQEVFAKATMNDGVAARIKQIPGAIGYMDAGYARLADWRQLAQLENKAGNYVSASPASSAAALADVSFPKGTLPDGAPDLRGQSPDPGGEDAYPMVAMTWMLFYATGYEGERLSAVRDLIRYCTSDAAQDQAAGLGYVPLPAPIIERVQNAAATIQ